MIRRDAAKVGVKLRGGVLDTGPKTERSARPDEDSLDSLRRAVLRGTRCKAGVCESGVAEEKDWEVVREFK